MEISGVIHTIMDTVDVTASFRKREFVIETSEQYPQKIIIQLTQDKVAILDEYTKGDNVTVSINIRGREWVNPEGVAKYFNSIDGWRVVKNDSFSGKPVNAESKETSSSNMNNMMHEGKYSVGNDDDDDLPF